MLSTTMRPPTPARALAFQPRRFEMQMQFIDERKPLDAILYPVEERGVGQASQVELVGQVVLQPLGDLCVRRRIRRCPPLLEQSIHLCIAVLCDIEGGGRLEKRRKGPNGKPRD